MLKCKITLSFNLISFNPIQCMFYVQIGKHIGHTVVAGVGNENLTKFVARNHLRDNLHALGVELVENIVKEQNGLLSDLALYVVELRELEADKVGFLLSLRTALPYAAVAKQESEVIAM